MKKITLLLTLPLWLTIACSSDKKPESGQSEPLTEQAEGGDPAARPQEYEHSTHDEVADTVPPVAPDTTQAD